MPGRTRTTLQTIHRGRMCEVSQPTCPIGNTMLDIGYSTVSDIVDEGDNKPFSVSRFELVGGQGGRINRSRADSGLYYLNEYVADYLVTKANFSHLGVSGMPSDSAVAAKAAARTNPSRPYVDLPVAIAELGDIVRLVRDTGASAIEKAAGANIKYQFGVLPLAGDIAKLIDFQFAFKKRMGELERLAGPRGLRRTVEEGGYSAHDSYTATGQSVGILLELRIHRFTRRRRKVHIRWKPDYVIPNRHSVQRHMSTLLWRTMLGFRNRASTWDHAASLWQAIPWSWLVDWFGNVGDYLNAQRNVIPASIESINLIDHRWTEFRIRANNLSQVKYFSPCQIVLEDKVRRAITFSSPVGLLPILSGRQVGILTSLSVLRGRRRVF